MNPGHAGPDMLLQDRWTKFRPDPYCAAEAADRRDDDADAGQTQHQHAIQIGSPLRHGEGRARPGLAEMGAG